MVAAGLPAEKRRFRAHLTLGRVRDRARAGARRDRVRRTPAPLDVHEVVLFRSDLGRDGSRYTPLARFRSPDRSRTSTLTEEKTSHGQERRPSTERAETASKRKAIELAVSTIEKQFGKGAILTMTEDGDRSRDRRDSRAAR